MHYLDVRKRCNREGEDIVEKENLSSYESWNQRSIERRLVNYKRKKDKL